MSEMYDVEAAADELADVVSDDEDYRRYQTRAALERAYLAGRESMREEAADACCCFCNCGHDIRALPLASKETP